MAVDFLALSPIARADCFMKSKLTLVNSTRQEKRKVAEICIHALLIPVLVMVMLKLTEAVCELLVLVVERF